jgi:hypothetical protein
MPHILFARSNGAEHAPVLREPAPDPARPVLQIIGCHVDRDVACNEGGEQRVELAWRIGLGADALEMMPQHVGEAAPRPQGEQRVLHPLGEDGERMAIVEHAEKDAARPQHAADLGDDALGMLGMVDDAPRPDDVETGIGERQGLSIDAAQIRGQAMEGEMCARRLDRGIGQVDPMADTAGARPLQMIRAGADADLEEPLTAMPRELRDSVDERLLGVAVRLDLGEPFLRARRQRAGDARVGADRAALPERADLVVELANQWGRHAALRSTWPENQRGRARSKRLSCYFGDKSDWIDRRRLAIFAARLKAQPYDRVVLPVG